MSTSDKIFNKFELTTDDDVVKQYGLTKKDPIPVKTKIKEEINQAFTCSGGKVKKIVQSLVPITNWIPNYKLKRDIAGDVTSGLTVGVVQIPQGMAYALLASLPPIAGLYTSFFPVLVYAIFASSKHLSMGTFAIVSLMVGGVIDQVVPDSYCDQFATTTAAVGSNTTDSMMPPCDVDKRKYEVAVALCVCVAILHFAMYVLRLGVIIVYLSTHMVAGFTCGAAFHVLTSQVPKLLGIYVPRQTGAFSLIYTYIELFKRITEINWATVILSAICIIFLMIGKEINLRFKKKLPFPLPWELVVVICTTLTSYFGYLNLNYNVKIIGTIPQGIQLSVPQTNDIGEVILRSVSIAIVSFSVSISMARMFSVKHGYDIDANQELLAYSLSNIISSFFSCFPGSASLSRTTIAEETGGNTQLTGIISSGIIVIVLFFIGPLFEPLPEAALASIIVVNLKRMLLQLEQLKPLFKISKLDTAVWFIAWLGVILFNVDVGLFIGLGFSLLSIVFRNQCANGNVISQIGDTGIYRNPRKFETVSTESIIIFKFECPIFFVNVERFKSQLYEAIGFEPSKEAGKFKRIQEKQKKLGRAVEVSSIAVNEAFVEDNNLHEDVENGKPQDGTPESQQVKFSKLNGVDLEVKLKLTSKKDVHPRTKTLCHVILDMSACGYIDNDGMKAMKSTYTNLKVLGIKFYLAGCNKKTHQTLIDSDFPSSEPDPDEKIFFINTSIAEAYARQGNSPRESTSSEESEMKLLRKTKSTENASTHL